MKTVRIIARVVVYDKNEQKILLARNKGAKFWYPPGGGWDVDTETILECAVREVYEESGLHVALKRLLYAQEFHESKTTTFLEFFWLAEPVEKIDTSIHKDLDPAGQVDEVKWFGKDELQDLKVFPQELKNRFWDECDRLESIENPFLGVF